MIKELNLNIQQDNERNGNMGTILTASAELKNDKMMFLGESGANSVITDYIPPYGDNLGFMPLQLFLVSLSACLGGTVQFLAKSMQRHIGSLKVTAEGERRQTHPTIFEHIRLSVHVVSRDLTEDEVRGMLQKAEETLCPVAAMVKNTVPLEMVFELSKS